MKKTLLMIVGATVALATANLRADQITGSITFGGTVTLNTESAGTATQVSAWHGVNGVGSAFTLSSSGDFSVVAPFTSVSIVAPYAFNSGPIAGFWSVGGFTFDLTFSTLSSQTANSVSATGMGIISGNGYDPTPGTWNFSTQDPSAGIPPVFSFSASSGAVPDGGTTVLLLGAALSGLGLLRRKLAA